MKSFLLVSFCLFGGNMIVAAQNEQPEAVEIPLDRIWAYQMEGTRDVRKLEPDMFGDGVRRLPGDEQARRYSASLVTQIRSSLQPAPAKSPGPANVAERKSGFAVSGVGIDALREAHAVLVKKRQPSQTFAPDEEISLVFTSNQIGRYVQIHSVERRGSLVTIRYRFVPHHTAEATEHFALIPVGKLPIGTVRVEIVQSPMEARYLKWNVSDVDAIAAKNIVSQPFSFVVAPKEKEE